MFNIPLPFNKLETKFLMIIGALLMFTYFPFVNTQNFSFDDYFLFFNKIEGDRTIRFSIKSGRWFGIFMYSVFNQLLGDGGFKGIIFAYFSVFVQFLFTGIVIVRVFKLDASKTSIALLVSMGFIHLFNAEIMTFKFGLLVNAGFSFLYLFAFGGWYLLRKSAKYFAIGVLFIVLALASYQIVINQLIVLSLLLIVFEFLEFIIQNKKVGFTFIKQSNGLIKLAGIITAVIVYVMVNKLVMALIGTNALSRSQLIQWADIPERLNQVVVLYDSILLNKDSYLVPFATKILTLIFMGLGIFTMGLKSFNETKGYLNKVMAFVFCLIISVLMIISSNFISLFIQEWWPTPRMFSGFGFMVMGFGLIVIKFSNIKSIKFITFSLGLLLVFSHSNITHCIAADQSYRNLVDRNKAQLIMSKVIQIDSFESKKIYIHQSEDCWKDNVNIKYKIGDLNLSSFCTSWSKYHLLEYVSGIKLIKTTNEENARLSEKVKNEAGLYQRWPNKGSIQRFEDFIIILP